MSRFRVENWFPKRLFEKICETRIKAPNVVRDEANGRKRRDNLAHDGYLAILAADHPGRMVTGDRLGNRYELLGRILRVLSTDGWDGVMVTPDVFEDLMIIEYLVRREEYYAAHVSFLEKKLIVGSMNRGGLAGTVFELDDRFTGFTAENIKDLKLDGAKMMFRLDPDSFASGKSVAYCAEAMRKLAKYNIPIFLECLWAGHKEKTRNGSEELIKVVSVGQALGNTPRNLWIKLPYCEEFDKVARSTTCPILILGGKSKNTDVFLGEISKALDAGRNVRGVLAGRNVLFPPDDQDPRDVAKKIIKLVHNR